MTIATTVETDGDRAVVVKRATGADVERLRLEGDRLERARHPGVVPVLRSEPTPEGWELCTAHRGRPVSAAGAGDPLSVAQVARLTAAVASTLADLHDLGLAHGRIDATHVLMGEHGRTVGCGRG
ncbi:MAG: phosphotransferase, partial [Acidimicrobiales bacterium]